MLLDSIGWASTFIWVISGVQSIADLGEIEWRESDVMAVYDQMGIQFNTDNKTVLEFVLKSAQSHDGLAMSMAPAETCKLLKQFKFP